MKLSEIIGEVELIVHDPRIREYLPLWINDAVFDIATEFDLPMLRRLEPFAFPVNNSQWLYDVPEIFHKKLFKCKNNEDSDVYVWKDIDVIVNTYYDLTGQETGVSVTDVSMCDIRRKLACLPMANDTLFLWFYNKPEYLDVDDDELTCIPENYQLKVLIPKIIIKNYQTMIDFAITPPTQGIVYWEAKYKEGLYGSLKGDIGMINYFASKKPSRRHGGRDPLP